MKNGTNSGIDGEGLSSPERLNDYIRVSNPSVWLALGAIIILLITSLIWSLSAQLDTVVSLSGVAREGYVGCYTARHTAKKLQKGQSVTFAGETFTGSVLYVSHTTLTREQAARNVGDDGTLAALLSDENCLVIVEAEDAPDGIYDMSIVVESVNPLSFVLN